MKEAEVSKENWNRWQNEPDIFATMLLDFDTLKLKRIDITGDRNNHEHNEMKSGALYLVCSDGRWFAGRALNNRNKWSIWLDGYSKSLRMFDIVFEITNLPKVEIAPLGRLRYEYEDADCDCECEYCCPHR